MPTFPRAELNPVKAPASTKSFCKALYILTNLDDWKPFQGRVMCFIRCNEGGEKNGPGLKMQTLDRAWKPSQPAVVQHNDIAG